MSIYSLVFFYRLIIRICCENSADLQTLIQKKVSLFIILFFISMLFARCNDLFYLVLRFCRFYLCSLLKTCIHNDESLGQNIREKGGKQNSWKKLGKVKLTYERIFPLEQSFETYLQERCSYNLSNWFD